MKKMKRIIAGLLALCLCLLLTQYALAADDLGDEDEEWEIITRIDSVKKLYTTYDASRYTNENKIAVIDYLDNLWIALAPDMEKMVKVMTNVSEVVFKYDQCAIICKDHSLWMWGDNEYGQIGNGTTESQDRPIKIMDNVEKVQLFHNSTAAIQSDGSLWVWGDNSDNRFGTDTGEDKALSPLKLMDNVKKVSFDTSNFILQNDGTLWGWGVNEYNLLGYQIEGLAKVDYPIQIMTDVFDFAGVDDCCPGECSTPGTMAVIKKDGSLWTWGGDEDALRGVKPEERIDEPMKIFDHVKKMTIGPSDAAVITDDGNLYVWGSKIGKSLVDRNEIEEEELDYDEYILVPKLLLTNIKDFFMAPDSDEYHVDGALRGCIAIENDGTLLTWGGHVGFSCNGSNPITILGRDNGDIYTPTAILENVVQAGYVGETDFDDYAPWGGAAVKEDGSLWVWHREERPVEFGFSQSGSAVFRREKEVTEDDLYGKYYKYLYNKSYNRMCNRLISDMSAINADRTKWENACSVLVSNMKNGAAASLVNSAISMVTGKYYNQDKLEQEIALEYLQIITEDNTVLQDVTNQVSKEFKLTSNVYKIISNGFQSYSEQKELAKTLAAGMYTEQEALNLIRSCETHWDEINDIFKKAGKVVNVAEVVTMIVITSQINKELTSSLMNEIGKDSALYRGLQSIRKIQKYPAEKLVTSLIKNEGLEKITDILSDNFVGRLSSLFGKTGGIEIGSIGVVVDIGYSFLGSVIGTRYAGSDDVVKAIISVSNVAELNTALSKKFQIIADNYNNHEGLDRKTLKSEYSMLYRIYIAALNSAVDAVSKVALKDSYKEALMNDYKKYNPLLTYKKYINSCLKNANSSWNYTFNQKNATITGTGSSPNGRIATVSEGSEEDIYALDIPDEINGYTVTEIGDAVFQDENINMVYIPGVITKVGNQSFRDCVNLSDIFLEKDMESVGKDAFPIDATVFAPPVEAANLEIIQMPEKLSYTMSELRTPDKTDVESGRMNCIDTKGMIIRVTYSDGTVKELEGVDGFIQKKTLGEALVNVYYGGQSISYPIQVTADDCTYTISYQNEAGDEIKETFLGTAGAGETITVSAPQIDGYVADEQCREEVIGADNYFVMTYHRIPEPSVDDADIIYQDSHKYTGSAITFDVTVKYKDKLLTENTDYVIEYENNINPGTAAFIVAGIGNYKGIVRKEFSILKPSVSAENSGKKNPGADKNETAVKKEVKVTKISLSGISKKIASGKKITLKADVFPSNATNKAVTWKSSNTKYATVNSKGVVTMKKAGKGKTVTITATAKDGSQTKAAYKIKCMKGVVKKIKLTAAKSVKAGKKVTVKKKITASKGANTALIYSVSNKKYAAVNKKGVVTTKKAGKGKTITVTAKATDGSGKKATVKIKIK